MGCELEGMQAFSGAFPGPVANYRVREAVSGRPDTPGRENLAGPQILPSPSVKSEVGELPIMALDEQATTVQKIANARTQLSVR